MIVLVMGLFAKKDNNTEEEIDKTDTIDAYELLALNQEAAKKEKQARQALMDKDFIDDDVSDLEFEATTTIKNVGELLNQIEEKEEKYESKEAKNLHITSKDHVDEVILLKEKIIKMNLEQRFQNQQLREQIFKLLSPFERAKNPAIKAQVQKIKKIIHEFTKDSET